MVKPSCGERQLIYLARTGFMANHPGLPKPLISLRDAHGYPWPRLPHVTARLPPTYPYHVSPAGFEPATSWFVAKRAIHCAMRTCMPRPRTPFRPGWESHAMPGLAHSYSPGWSSTSQNSEDSNLTPGFHRMRPRGFIPGPVARAPSHHASPVACRPQ